MKNNSKRICALLLAIVMCIGCVVPVFAETANSNAPHSHDSSENCVYANDKGEHIYVEGATHLKYVDTVAPKCGATGYDLYECVCGARVATNFTNVDSDGHQMGEWQIITPPKCDEYGVMKRVCTKCSHDEEVNADNYAEKTASYGEAVTKAIKPLEHKNPDGSSAIENDLDTPYICANGNPEYNEWCTLCGDKDVVPAGAAKDCDRYVAEVIAAPNCYETGLAVVKCRNEGCTYSKTEVLIKAVGAGKHTWDDTKIVVATDPTCGTAGSGTVFCKVCKSTHNVVENKVTVTYVTESGVSATDVVTLPDSYGFAKLAHDFSGEIVKGSAASCKETGIRDHYVCKNGCGAISLDKTNVCTQADLVIGKVAHTWGALVDKTEATCTVSGKKAHKVCSVCAAYLDVDATTDAGEEVVVAETDLVIAPAHDYGTIELDANGAPTNKPKLNSESSCYEYGFWVYTCRKCGKPADTSVEANLPHGAAGWVSSGVYRLALLEHTLKTTEGSCTEDHVEECTVPGCGYKKTTPAPDHKLATVKVAATCHTDGYWFDYCTVCGLKDTANDDGIVELDECVYVRIETTEPTESGKAKTDALGRYEISPMNPANHDWDEMQTRITTAPTCVSDGMALKYCPWCDDRQDVPLPALGHDVDSVTYKDACYKDEVLPTCTQDGYFIYGCSRCDDEDRQVRVKASALPTTHAKYSATAHNKLDHKFVLDDTATDYVVPVNTPATCYSSGYDLYTCVRCNNTEAGGTKMVDEKDNGDKLYPKLNHKYADGTSAITRKEYDPKCKPTVVDGIIKLTGENGYVIDTCALCAAEKANNANYQTDYPLTITYEELLAAATTEAERDYAAQFLFNWNNKKHHPDSKVNPDTFYHYDAATGTYYVFGTFDADGNLIGDEAARQKYIDDNEDVDALNGIIRVGKCDVSSIVDYYCPTCKYTFHHIDDTMVGKHVVLSGSEVAQQDPTCTAIGKYAHYKCSVCECDVRITFDVNGKEVHTVYDLAKNPGALDIAALGHDWVEKAGATPDCVNGGSKKYYDCSRCDLYTLDKDAATVVTFDSAKFDENVKLPANGHSWGTKLDGTPATCTANGKYDYYDCANCDAVSLNGETACAESALVIDMLGHDMVDCAKESQNCLDYGYQVHYCRRCGTNGDGEQYVDNYKYADGHTFENVGIDDSTCTELGTAAHVKCTVCKKLFAEGTTDVYSTSYVTEKSLEIAKKAHKDANGNDIVLNCKPGADFSDTNTIVCDVCKNSISITHTSLKTNDVDASCTEYGYTIKYCADCGYNKFTKKDEFKPTGHDFEWIETLAPDMYTTGLETLMCVNANCDAHTTVGSIVYGKTFEATDAIKDGDTALDENGQRVALVAPESSTRAIPATGGIEFSYEIDNAIVSGAEYVNGGKIKLTISYKAANVDIASIALRLNYAADVLTFVSGDFKCEAKDGDKAVFNIENASIGGKTAGFVIVKASTTGFGEAPANKKLDGEGIFAEIYFDINKNVDAGATIGFTVAETGDLASGVYKVEDGQAVAVAASFGTVASELTKALGDIDIDTAYTSADEVEFLNIAFGNRYVAEADINQDGIIGSDDYALLNDLLLGNITYAEMCAAAQAKPVA